MLSITQFISKIRQGYSYCHVFYNNRRTNNNFIQTNVISIDIDKNTICLADFIDSILLKPTFAYETFSNGLDERYSYRIVYVIREPLNKNCYIELYEKICRMTNLTKTADSCGKTLAQLMNGTKYDAYIYRSGIVYSIIDDLPLESKGQIDYKNEIVQTIYNPIIQNNNYNNKIISSNNQKQYNTKFTFCKSSDSYLMDLVDEITEIGRAEFLQKYKNIYKLIRQTKLTFNELGYTIYPKDYKALFVRYNTNETGCTINRFKDGEKRRNRLFIDGCIIRKINPEITLYELFYNLVHRVYFYYNNDDNVLNEHLIAQKAIDVMNYDVATMDFSSKLAGHITTSQQYCVNHGISRRSLSRKALQIENYTSIQNWYDENKSISENFKTAIALKQKVCKRTLRNYCKFYNIDPNPNAKAI